MDSERLQYALRYAAFGWRVFPLIGKKPAVAGGHGVLDATTDTDIIRACWTANPDYNIGWHVGEEYWVLDVDPRHGGDETLESLELKHGKLPNTLQQISGRGVGLHKVFNRPPNTPMRALVGKIGDGLDIRTGNTYIVLTPSIHPETRGRYEWDGLVEFEEQPILYAPEWLLTLALNGSNPGISREIPEMIPHGTQHAHLVSFAGTMRRRDANEEKSSPRSSR